jgi:DNA-binding NarL/FixJ family response regulator
MKPLTINSGKSAIMLVDDHPLVRYGLIQLIDSEPDMFVCCEAGGCRETLKALESNSPDLVIVDLSMNDGNGLDLIKDIRHIYPSLSALVLSMHDESLYAERALKAGARGYVMKQAGTKDLIKAIRTILAGQIFVSQSISSRLIAKQTGHASDNDNCYVGLLSDRELEVFEMIGKGLKTGVIAELLHLSIKTIETYRANIKKKLDLPDSSKLTQAAVAWINSLDK